MEPFLGEIRCFAFGRIPTGWLQCAGQLLSVSSYSALYSLIGTQYGGNGTTNFALPDLRGRVPMHYNSNVPVGQMAGFENVTVTAAQVGSHNHMVAADSNPGTKAGPTGHFSASSPTTIPLFASGGTQAAMAPGSIGPAFGGNQPHNNMQPFLTVSYCIAMQGQFPSRP
jgi:microcystin-dependent protein